jgi:hypothetical protein
LESLLSQWVPQEAFFKRVWNRDIGALNVHHHLPKVISQIQFWVGDRAVRTEIFVDQSYFIICESIFLCLCLCLFLFLCLFIFFCLCLFLFLFLSFSLSFSKSDSTASFLLLTNLLKQIFSRNTPDSSPSSVYEFLVLLAQHLDCPNIAKLLKANFAYLVKTPSDLGEKLKSLFVTFDKNSKFVKVLKLLHFDILLPALLKLRHKIYHKFPFKEVKGGWSITITLTTNNEIIVLHKKREQSHDTNPQSYFEFLWELEFRLNK